MKVTRKLVNSVMETILSTPSFKQVTGFCGPFMSMPVKRVKATRVRKAKSQSTTLVVTISRLNYEEKKYCGRKLKAQVNPSKHLRIK